MNSGTLRLNAKSERLGFQQERPAFEDYPFELLPRPDVRVDGPQGAVITRFLSLHPSRTAA